MSDREQYNILIVDEDEATRCTLADLLRGRDEYRVLVAGEGREAVKMFVEEARIDIVLTDIHMPGFNCLELMSDMQRLRHRPEILIMTSNGSAEVVEQARRIGARSIILKPFEHLDLIEAEVERAVQALFEARATTSCRMMFPPSGTRGAAAPDAPRRSATAGPAPEAPRAAAPAFPHELPDAGLTMRIDRPDFAVAPDRPNARPEPETMQPLPRPALSGLSTRPAAATTPAPADRPGGGEPRQSTPADRMRGRVGLPDLGALKTKLFGKRTDLSGGHLARPFPDLVPSGDSPPAPPSTSPAAAEAEMEDEPIVLEVENDEADPAAAAPVEETREDEPIALEVEASAAAGNEDGEAAAGVPAELQTILAAGADLDLGKMTLQIPIICLRTWEEQAALDALRPMAGTMKRAFFTWSATRGIVKEDGTVMGEMYCDPIQGLEFIRRQKTNGLFVLIDFHNWLEDRKVARMLREMFAAGETGRGILVLTGPVMPIPPELQPFCQVFDWPRGGEIDFDQVLEEVRSELTTAGGDPIDLDPEARRLLHDRVRGMPAGRARFAVLCALRSRGQSGG
jgi:CheY-like chemotaxis protein